MAQLKSTSINGNLTVTGYTTHLDGASFSSGSFITLNPRVKLGASEYGGCLKLEAIDGNTNVGIRFANTAGFILSRTGQNMLYSTGPESYYHIVHGVMDGTWTWAPETEGQLWLGTTNHPWGSVYIKGGPYIISDERKKNILNYVQDDKRYFDFYEKLNSILYTWKDQENDKVKVGLGAQTVEKALNSSGLTNDDFSGLCHEGDSYSLDYISYLMIGDAYNKNKIKELEERIAKLESR